MADGDDVPGHNDPAEVMEEDDEVDDNALVLADNDDELLENFVVMEELDVDDEDDESWAAYESDDTDIEDENEDQEGAGADEHSRGRNNEQDESNINFDQTLPSRHQYLGETEELSGRTLQDENDYITIPLLLNESLMGLVLIPTQTLPMTIYHPGQASMLRNVIAKDKTFGVVHSKPTLSGTPEMAKYGTTAEIFEFKDSESGDYINVKAKGRQRFKIMNTRREVTGCLVAQVKILPEVHLPDPFEHMRLRSLDKFTLSPAPTVDQHALRHQDIGTIRSKKSQRVRRYNAWMTPWPSWVYDQYDEKILAQKLKNKIVSSTTIQDSSLKIPSDPHELSHWAAINLPLDYSHRLSLLSLDSPIQRMRYVLSVLDKCEVLACRHCNQALANVSNIFSMSVEGPQGTYVNPAGYVHEMLAVSKAKNLLYTGRPSTDHSWFPGYAWTIANCSRCRHHIGWKFTATKRKLKPQKLYGLSRKCVRGILITDTDQEEGEMRHVI